MRQEALGGAEWCRVVPHYLGGTMWCGLVPGGTGLCNQGVTLLEGGAARVGDTEEGGCTIGGGATMGCCHWGMALPAVVPLGVNNTIGTHLQGVALPWGATTTITTGCTPTNGTPTGGTPMGGTTITTTTTITL